MNIRLFILLVAMLIVFATGCATADQGSVSAEQWPAGPKGPWEELEMPSRPSPEGWEDHQRRVGRGDSGIFAFAYRFYSQGLTQIDGARCEHRPTCSRYAYEAIQKRGMLMGSFLTVDRLMRGDRSSVLRRLPIHMVHEGNIYYRDPIEANDFFL